MNVRKTPRKRQMISFKKFCAQSPGLGVSSCAFFYARDVIGGRWPKGESMMNPVEAVHYAKYVMKGRLPDELHNKMILLWSQSEWANTAKKYLKMLEYIEKGISVHDSWNRAFSIKRARKNNDRQGTH